MSFTFYKINQLAHKSRGGVFIKQSSKLAYNNLLNSRYNRAPMSLRVIGINHKTAPVAIREKVAFSPDGLIDTLSQIYSDIENNIESNNKQNEVIILSTCNRTEIYTYSNYSEDQILNWLSKQDGMDSQSVKEYIYDHSEDEAIKHVMRVASGLDSMVLGEPQILGQMKDAFATAHKTGVTGKLLNQLFQHTFSVAKHSHLFR